MSCPVCADVHSHKVFSCGSSITHISLDDFHDTNDKYHRHDKSETTSFFKCTEGHIWSVQDHFGECECGWKAYEHLLSKTTLHNSNQDVEMEKGCPASG